MPKLKAPSRTKHFLNIKEVSRLLGEAPSTLRYWETEFPHLAPRTTSGGTRQYAPKDIEALQAVRRLLREKKLTIRGAKEALKSERQRVRLGGREHTLERLYRLRQHLQEIRSELEKL